MRVRSQFPILKRFLCTRQIKPKICVVGAGPAGFYAAQHLVKKLQNVEVDIYERLPVPFGLVRFGVAPDHPEVKNVIHTFTKTAELPQLRFLGNVNLGSDVSLEQLKRAYHVVLLTYGAEKSRKLNIPGEDTLKNVIEARKIVGWYNGLPWDKNLDIDLSGETVAIIGQGNVAIDVARILLTPIDQLKETDITEYALEALRHSKVKTVHLIGRRGPLQAACTIKELREMLKLNNCTTVWKPEDFIGIQEHVPKLARPRKRLTELMLKSLAEEKDSSAPCTFKPIFFRSPLEILGESKVEGLLLGVNKLEGADILNQRAILTDARDSIKCDLVVPSIGYKSIQADESIPFDSKRGMVNHLSSRVATGVYVTGWLGTGPTGVIVTTMGNAFGVADLILHDIETENLVSDSKGGYEEIMKLLEKNNVQVVGWKEWEKIDKMEQSDGQKVGKPREKIVCIDEMLKIAAL